MFGHFYNGSAYGPKGVLYNSLTGINRSLLYPAIRAVAATPTGLARSTLASTYGMLTLSDTLAVADSIVDSVQFRAPADKMFTSGVRQGGIGVLQKYGFAEGIPLSRIYMENDGRGTVQPAAIGILQAYAGACTKVVPDSGAVGYLKALGTTEAQAALAAIVAVPNTNPGPATPLKSIQSVTADASTLTLPARSTVLRVSATDYARGPAIASVYTWRKVHGAGAVTFSPNGTTASANSAVQIDSTPGKYLFELTMSDSRGLTEVAATVPVTLYNSAGILPPNIPPVANTQQVIVAKATPLNITLTASDPEGYALVYRVISQPINGSLSGDLPNLVYTPNSTYSGPDSFVFEVIDSEGQKASATVDITVSSSPPPLAIYEPFNYPPGGLNGKGTIADVGLTGTWIASVDSLLVASSPNYGSLPVSGGSIGGMAGGINRFGGSRAVSPSALAGNGLLADGATLWVSLMMGYDTGQNNCRLAFALANSRFNAGNYNYNIDNEGLQVGSGVGVSLSGNSNGVIQATQFRDSTSGSGFAGNILGAASGTLLTGGQSRLIVCKITWGAGATDSIQVYAPDTSLNLGPIISTLAVDVNQSTFDTITWSRGDKMVMDEIRLGSSYSSVLFGTTPDLSPPTPNPSQWAAAPVAISTSAITMTAAAANDPSGVQYYFDCITVGGHDSTWQDSPTYTDTGLAPLTSYSYQVKTRDKSSVNNTGTHSSVLSATTESGDILPPSPSPMQWITPPTPATTSSVTMTAVDAEDPSGVEYYFANLTFTNGSHDSGWQDSPIFTDTGLSQSTNYSYQVRVRDKSPNANVSDWSAVAITSIAETTPPTLTSIANDKSGGPIIVNSLVNYTVTFSENMDASTVTAADFGNSGSANVSIDTINEIAPGVFTVSVYPTDSGTLRLQIKAGAVLMDVAGNALVTTAAIQDDTVIIVQTKYAAWAGTASFDVDTNGDGVKNGIAWLLGAAGPSANATALLPKATNESGKLVITFRCLKSASRIAAVLKLQYTNDLGLADSWTNHEAVIPDVDGTFANVFFDISSDADPEFINVRAEIPANAALPTGKCYGRLHSTVN